MGQSPEELASEIADTRERMAANVDTLQDRVSPAAIVERRKQAARDRASSVKDKVMGKAQSASSGASDAGSNAASAAQDQFHGTPLAAGLIAFGAGMVLASLLPASKVEAEAAHRVVETAKEHQDMLDGVKEAGQATVDKLKQSATESVQQVKDSAQQSAQTVKDEGQSSVGSVKDQASS